MAWALQPTWLQAWHGTSTILNYERPLPWNRVPFPALHTAWISTGLPLIDIGVAGLAGSKRRLKLAFAMAVAIASAACQSRPTVMHTGDQNSTADLKRVRQSDPVAMSMSRPCQETHRAVNFYIIGDPNALFVLISNGRFDNLRAQN